MIFCPECHAENSDGLKYCLACNARLDTSPVSSQPQAEFYFSTPGTGETPSQSSPSSLAAVIAESEAKDKALQRIFFGVIAGVAILAIMMAAYFIYNDYKPSATPAKKISSPQKPFSYTFSPVPAKLPSPAEIAQPKAPPLPEKETPKSLPAIESKSAPAAKAEPAINASKPNKPMVYFLQLAAFTSTGETLKLCKKVQAAGFECYFGTVTLPKGRFYRLRVGPYNQEAEAKQALEELASKGFTGRLITLNATVVKPPIQLRP